MKILAIRGRNLASLAGDFEIRLDAPPLADAGLFAITGRTGAGKSTILDALCLALFDRMPRLPVGRGADVGRADDAPEMRLRDNDVRWVLRRGAGEGYAEVDFLGVDARRYRARWTVRRARERSSGRLQPQTMALKVLDSSEDLSAAKTEVLDAIQTRLGLTFDQFRRSVLLAQGDFAAFLRADVGERAELLERITGTGIYGEISKAAHRRAADAHKQLELIRQRLGDQRPLDEAGRNTLETELAEARRMLDEQHRTQQALQRAQLWHQTLEKLSDERDQCAAQLAEAQSDHKAAESRRREFERIQALHPLRLLVAAFDQATEAVHKSREDLDKALSELHDKEQAAEHSTTAAATCESGYQRAQKAMEDASPALLKARHLDTRVQQAREQAQSSATECASAEQVLQKVQAERDELQGHASEATEKQALAEKWLGDQAVVEPLAIQWEAWARELERYAQANSALDKARADVKASEQTGAELTERHSVQEPLIAQISADRSRAAAKRAELEEQVSAFDLDRLATNREECLARRGAIDHWRRLAEQARESHEHLDNIRAGIAGERVRQARSNARSVEIEPAIGALTVTLAEAEATHRRLLIAQAGEVKRLRAQLEEGQPCSVCGSQEHPWAHRAETLLMSLADEQDERVAMLKRQFEEMTAERAQKRAESAQAGYRAEELALELEAGQARLDRILENWTSCETDALRPPDPLQEGVVERQTEEIETLTQTLKQIAQDEDEGRALLAQVRDKISEIEGLDARLDSEQRKLAELARQIGVSSEACAHARSECFRWEETMGQVLGLVVEPLAGISDWRARLSSDHRAFIDACRHQVDAWRQQTEQRDLARRALQDLAPRLAHAEARYQSGLEDLTRRRAMLDQQSRELEDLEHDRAELLEGRPADVVESELSAAATQARQRWEQSRADLAKAREALTAAEGVVGTLGQTLQGRQAAAAQVHRDLEREMALKAVALGELREALRRDHDWIERERLALQALVESCDRAQELLKERERRLEEHRDADPPQLSVEQVVEQLPIADESVKSAQDRWGALHGRLAEDERRRKASRETQAELERQQASWELWESLRELIGSADGAKFRNFAQGLTLDLLVAHANVHLRDLARRYELQRVPGAEMQIQVIDREMGDEVRSVHSLSGGESFLASLALALGLASLASDRVQVESLFIDEGFGALDADSLDLAIAGLDVLYSLGRQVGVISHVGTLVERIGVKVQVSREGGGRSRLEVLSG